MTDKNSNAEVMNAAALMVSGRSSTLHMSGNSTINIFSTGISRSTGNNLLQKVEEPSKDDKDLTWLVEGKIVLYKKRLLNKIKRTVFYGRQQHADYWREIAIKVIQSEERYRNELRLLLKLRHPNIVQLIDSIEIPGHANDFIYIVMELCCQNLRTYVEENDFDFKNSFSFIRQIVEGLVYLHENNVTHRDLKPANVLISLCKKFAKLSDFGLSKEIPEGQSKATVTTIGAGTEGYRAPETYHDNSHVSPSIDIFSFGLVAHFTFTNGKHPFGSNPYKWSVNIMENQNRDLTQILQFKKPHAHKREQLIDLLHQTLQPSPIDRPAIMEIRRSQFIADSPEDDTDVSPRMNIRAKKDLEVTAMEIEKEESKIVAPVANLSQKSSGSEVLDELRRSPIDRVTWLSRSDELESLLGKAECELRLARGKEEEFIQQTRDFISSSGLYSVQDVWEMAYELTTGKSYVRSLILYRISNDLYKPQNVSPDDAVNWIRDRAVNILYAAQPLIESGGRSRDIGIKYGLEYIEGLLSKLRAIQNATPDVKVLNEVDILHHLTCIYGDAGEHQKTISYCSEGVNILEEQFGSYASENRVYGVLLHNLGSALHNSGHYLDAENYYLKAIEAKKRAYHGNENEKIEDIEMTQRSLALVRKSVGTQSNRSFWFYGDFAKYLK